MTALRILGTGNAQALKCYNTCFTIENSKGVLLVDGGGGNTILSILEEEKIPLSSIRSIFVTHIHTDHIFGVIWVLRRIGEEMLKGRYEGNLTLHTHSGAAAFIEYVSKAVLTKKLVSLFGERIIICVHDHLDSTEILGNRVTVFDTGSLKMKEFGFLMEGDDFTLLNAGDEPLREENFHLGERADWMTHEAFCLYSDRDIFKPYEKSHSTAKDAAETAERLGVRNLVLYHTEDRTLGVRKEKYTAEAKEYFSGNVFVPDDRELIVLSEKS